MSSRPPAFNFDHLKNIFVLCKKIIQFKGDFASKTSVSGLCSQDMLKNSIRTSVLSKCNNVTYCCFRNFYQKMQNQDFNNKNQDTSNFMKTSFGDEENNKRDNKKDVLKNIRKWIPIDQTNKPGFIFTIFNYNILSQQLLECHNYLYQESPRAALKWSNRLYNIVGEIFKTNPSILCCQVRTIPIIITPTFIYFFIIIFFILI